MLDPRRVAGLLDAPGCRRRQVLDTAAVDLDALAKAIGAPTAGQSPYARERNGTFAQLALAELPTLTRRAFGWDCGPARDATDLAEILRATGPGLWLLREPELPVGRLRVAADLVILAGDGAGLHPVEIRSYACLDGHADPSKVADTARELAVTLLGLRELTSQLGHQAERIRSQSLLVLPRNFGLTPVGTRLDVAPQARRLHWMLSRLPYIQLPDGDLLEELARFDARFGDGCPRCPLYTFCREQQQRSGSVARAGAAVANLCGPVGTAAHALALAHGERAPQTEAEQAIAAELARAAQAHAWAGRLAQSSVSGPATQRAVSPGSGG